MNDVSGALRPIRKLLCVIMAVVLAVGLMPAAAVASDEVAPQAGPYSVSTKVSMGTITPTATVNAGDSMTVSYAPIAADRYLYRVSVDGVVAYLDADGDGTPEQGSAAVQSSYTFDNVSADHAISVIYMPSTSGIAVAATATVNGASSIEVDPFEDSADYTLDYSATISVSDYASYGGWISSLEVTVYGVYDPNLDASNVVATMASPGFSIVDGSTQASDGVFKATIKMTSPASSINWYNPIVLNMTGVKLTRENAKTQAGGEIVALGSYSGQLKAMGFTVGVGGSTANPAVVKVAAGYYTDHYLQQTDGSYALNSTDQASAQSGSSVTATPGTFAGYTYNADKSTATGTVTPAADPLHLSLYYSLPHKVTFDTNGHGTAPAALPSVAYGSTITEPTAPTAAGWQFDGWFTDAACTVGNEWNFATDTMPDSDKTLYAKWTSVGYQVSFFDGFGNQIGTTQTVQHGHAATAPTAPQHAGYTFTGWDKAFDNITADTTVTATWDEQKVALTYVAAAGGKVSPTGESVGKTTGVAAGSTATANTGYHFVAWRTASGGTVSTSATFVPTKPGSEWVAATYTAFFELNKHTVTFDANGHGSAPIAQTGVAFGSPITDPGFLQATGYTFGGWFTDAACTDGNQWNFTTGTMPDNDLTLYAKWSGSQYTVTFTDGNGTTLKTQMVNHGDAATAPAAPTRSGYTFAGWDKAFDNITADTTVNATWKENDVTVNYAATAGGSVTPTAETVKAQTGTLSGSKATADTGYHFVNWTDTSAAVVSTTAAFTPAKPSTGFVNATYTAHFAANTHKVTFDVQGVGTAPAPMNDVAFGTALPRPADPSAEGWVFGGWFTDAACTAGNDWNFATDTMPDADLTLYAKWGSKESDDPDLSVARLFGADRLQTASTVAQYNRPHSNVVFLASSEDRNWPDALTAAGGAGLEQAPIVLTPFGDTLGADAADAIAKLGATKVIICGGTTAVSSAVEKALQKQGLSVTRLGGANRMQTAEAIYNAYKGQWSGDNVIVCTGMVFADALSISPYAYAAHSPILLSDFSTNDLTPETKAAIAGCTASGALICGGTAAVGSGVDAAITSAKPSLGTPTRIFGATRYETSAKIADFELADVALGFSANNVAFARGQHHADALVGGALQGSSKAPLILVDPGWTDYATSFLHDADGTITEMRFFGGTSAVNDTTVKLLVESVHYKQLHWLPDTTVALGSIRTSNPTPSA